MDFSDVDSASSEVGAEVSEVENKDTDFGDGDGVNDFDEIYNEMNSGNESLEYSEGSEGTDSYDFDENKSDETTDAMVDDELSEFDDSATHEGVDSAKTDVNSDVSVNQSDMTTDESVDDALSDFEDNSDDTDTTVPTGEEDLFVDSDAVEDSDKANDYQNGEANDVNDESKAEVYEDSSDAEETQEVIDDNDDSDSQEVASENEDSLDAEKSEDTINRPEDAEGTDDSVTEADDAEAVSGDVNDTEEVETTDADHPEEAEDTDEDSAQLEEAEDTDADAEEPEETEDTDADAEEPEETEDTNADGEEPQEAEDTEASTEEPQETEDTNVDADQPEEAKDTDAETDQPEDAENTDAEPKELDKAEELEGYHDIAEFNDDLNSIYSDVGLSNQEKVDAAKEFVERLNHSDLSPEEKKQSIDAPSEARALKNPENSDWTERTDDNPWPPLNIDFPDKMGLDYDKEISPLGRDASDAQLPETGYRYGGEGGYNYTCEKEDGHVPTLDERSLPKEYVPEKDREVHFDNDRYCDAIDAISGYDSNPAESLSSINSMIDDINAERGTDIKHLEPDELEALSDKYQQLQDTEFADVRDEMGIDDRDFTKYGVHGYAKPMEDISGDTICEGGADQFNTALPEYMLKRIGVEY